MNLKRKAEINLILVVLFWGTTFPLIEQAVAHIDPIGFVFFRFALAALLLFPIAYGLISKSNYYLVMISALLGLFNCVVYVTQSMGLKTISSGESAFITSASIIFVPFLSFLFRIDSPRCVDIFSSFFGFLGLYVLIGTKLHFASPGEWLTLCSALFIALSIVFIQIVSKRFPKLFTLIAFYQILFTAIISLVFSNHIRFSEIHGWADSTSILFCSLFATTIAMLLQTQFQRYTTTTKAALIFCLEPVFAIIVSYLINGNKDPLTGKMIMGGALIFLGILMPEFPTAFWKRFSFIYKKRIS